MANGFLALYTVEIVQRHNPNWRAVVQSTLSKTDNIRRSTQILLMRAKAEQLFGLLASYRQPDNFFEKSRAANVFAEFRIIYGGYFMPKRQAKPNTSAERAEWKGFIERRLSEPELEEFDNQEFQSLEVLAALDNLLSEDYRLTLSYQAASKSYTATLMDQRLSRSTAGYALSASDASGYTALCMLLYKHIKILGEDWSTLLGEGRPSRRG
jgi:hypothetical protein